uniref:Uncharacterized protein n=1 Tax=Vitis vinifera TaxID=29760 RepID=A5C5J5_VITVI|nr:hypothetical protein VITISV_023938 [Vitis vinifera]
MEAHLTVQVREHLEQDRNRIVRSGSEIGRSDRRSESGAPGPLRRSRRRSEDFFETHPLPTDSCRHRLVNPRPSSLYEALRVKQTASPLVVVATTLPVVGLISRAPMRAAAWVMVLGSFSPGGPAIEGIGAMSFAYIEEKKYYSI